MGIHIDHVNNNHNIELLKNRKRGDIYYCDGKGLLKRMSFIKKIFYLLNKIFSGDYYKNIQSSVKHSIDKIISTVDLDNEKELMDLFFSKLRPLSESIFDRSKINPKVLRILREHLSKVSDYQKLCEKQKACQSNFLIFSAITPSKKTKYNNIERIKNVVLEALLSTNLGVRTKKPKSGFSETYFIRDINGRIIGIFKTARGDSLSLKAPFILIRWRNKILSKIGYRHSLYKHVTGNCHIAEVASYEIDESIGTHVVPPTAIVSLAPKSKKSNPKMGSLQIFIPDVISAKDFLGVNKRYKPAKIFTNEDEPQLADELFEKLIINDVVCGNLDRHAENWLIDVDKNNPSKANNIVLIDGGMAFSPTHALSSFERDKQYAWATTALKWSQRKFSNKAKKIIKDVYTRRFELKDQLIKLYLDQKDRLEVAKSRGDRMLERIEMLHHVAIEKNMKKYKLFNYRTQQEMEQFRITS